MPQITLKRDQSLGEEIANSISHGVGFLGAVAVTPIKDCKGNGAAAVVGASILARLAMFL